MPEFPDTNLSLIARVQQLGNGSAWEEFLAIYRPAILQMARRRGLQDADAHDVLQQVLLSVSQSIERWTAGDNQPPFRAWLTTVARNAITKSLTRQPRDRGTGSTSVMKLLHTRPNVDAEKEMDSTARHELVFWTANQIRGEFSDATWSAFWQTAVEGHPAGEVAKRLGRSRGAIYVARFRVTTRLKEKVLEASRQWDL